MRFDQFIVSALLGVLLIALCGCGAVKVDGGNVHARTTTTVAERQHPDGTVDKGVTETVESTAQQPENPADGASAKAGDASAALHGGANLPDIASEKRAGILTWGGIICLLVGAGMLALRFTSLPFAIFIPWTGAVACILVGALLLSWHLLAGPFAIAACIAAIGFAAYFLIHNGVGLNVFKAKAKKAAEPKVEPTPPRVASPPAA